MNNHPTNRSKTKVITVGSTKIGGENPITIQSMTNTNTSDTHATITQIKELTNAGCEIIRVAVPDTTAAAAIKDIAKNIHIPLVADIHFDYRLALAAMENGVNALRINPGNIGDKSRIAAVVKMAQKRNIPIRIGVNGGSLEKNILAKHGLTATAMVESAINHIKILEQMDFYDIVISLKASSLPLTIEANKKMAEKYNYPLHLGITEAGTIKGGSIKSSVGLGILLNAGLGSTIRVSLTEDPVEEIYVAKEILKSLGLRRFGVEFVSCPTCGRTQVDLISIAKRVEDYCSGITKNIKVAVMGCVVNGPGEAKEADIAIAAGRGEGLIIKKGQIMYKVPEDKLIDALIKEIEAL